VNAEVLTGMVDGWRELRRAPCDITQFSIEVLAHGAEKDEAFLLGDEEPRRVTRADLVFERRNRKPAPP
jgi:hypothetical protein